MCVARDRHSGYWLRGPQWCSTALTCEGAWRAWRDSNPRPAAARNAHDLLHDAEVLAEAGRSARAHALAALAIEEVGKAGSLATLTAMPETVRAQAPVGRMLEWH